MSRFAQTAATVPEPCRVLGTALRPFSLGHHLLFKRLKLPLCGNALADASPEEFLFAICICGQRYEETLEQMLAGEWENVFAEWKGKIEEQKHLVITPFCQGCNLFRAYLQDGYEHAPVWKHMTVNGIMLSAPWEILLKNTLVLAGYSETEVLNGYLPGRWYDYYCVTELRAAENCRDDKKWRKVFYTEDDARALRPPRKEGK